MIVRCLYASSLLFLLSTAAYPDLLLPRNASWQYLKGTAEASAPVDAWRLTGFDDSSWNTGSPPIRYGDGVGGTILDDMRGNYTSVFMRRSFNVPDLAQVARLNLNVDWDDGYLLWINGVLVDSRNPPDSQAHDGQDQDSQAGPGATNRRRQDEVRLIDGDGLRSGVI